VAGLVTVTGTVPEFAICAALTVAISWFPLTAVVVKAVPFQFTVAVLKKLLPFTVIVNPAPPAVVLFGASWLMAGIVPAVAGVVAFELYPQPIVNAIRATSNTVQILFILSSKGVLPYEGSLETADCKGVSELSNVCNCRVIPILIF
jgi:hypothetical protein